MGGDGVISVAANQIPSQIKQLINAVKAGNLDGSSLAMDTSTTTARRRVIVPGLCGLFNMPVINLFALISAKVNILRLLSAT